MSIPQKTRTGSVLEFYEEKILKEQIENYWKEKYQSADGENRNYYEQNNTFSSFNNANITWPKRFNRYFPELYRKEFPKAFEHHTDELLEDLRILLPNNDMVKSVLPVLMMGYVLNKKPGDSFVTSLTNEHLGEAFPYDEKTKLFLPPSLIENYTSLKNEKFVPHPTKTLFHTFLHPVLFCFSYCKQGVTVMLAYPFTHMNF